MSCVKQRTLSCVNRGMRCTRFAVSASFTRNRLTRESVLLDRGVHSTTEGDYTLSKQSVDPMQSGCRGAIRNPRSKDYSQKISGGAHLIRLECNPDSPVHLHSLPPSPTIPSPPPPPPPLDLDPRMKTVVVLGGSYGGARAAAVLAQGLPENWRIVLIDRNSHANHLYVLPRYAVLPGHEHKAFIPYTGLFPSSSRHLVLHAHVTSISSTHISLSRSFPQYTLSDSIEYDYCIYALGSKLPEPIDIWSDAGFEENRARAESDGEVEGKEVQERQSPGTKKAGMQWLVRGQERIRQSQEILIIGGGALGIQFASDIKDVYPEKNVTLLHSRSRLLPRFDCVMHSEIIKSFDDLGVRTILNDRLDLSSLSSSDVPSIPIPRATDPALSPLPSPTSANDEDRTPEVQDPSFVFPTSPSVLDTSAIPDSPASLSTTPSLTEIDSIPSPLSTAPTSPSSPSNDTLPPTPKLKEVRTTSGRTLSYDLLLLCTGQIPNTSLLKQYAPNTIDEKTGLARVLRTLQLAPLPPTEEEDDADPKLAAIFQRLGITSAPSSSSVTKEKPRPYSDGRIFVIGDAADAFGAIKAGHNAYYQGELAARNVLALINRDSCCYAGEGAGEDECELEEYVPGEPAIKLSLGLKKSVYQTSGIVGTKDEETEDLDAPLIWRYFGAAEYVEKEGGLFE
ncbi:hypothetical protein SISNIDRAFT_439211 [Sistotremastrum niveocremeum HHB9708]|uniref:FAD/NAD(P)-binding domain-containing protein n=1 Tax=Sistotremastrum niveocremeum HHB9708 TaxID=1314777 RepID=A0A164WLZ2_9AGAM|nr:hypothetical protein SISNIDRAFT_439211 [Sistotremastrum niveocremeum HHB9708]